MSFKSLLVHVDDSKHCSARLAVAASLARRFEAHLTGLYISSPVDVSPFLADQFPPGMLDEAHARVAEGRDKAKALFDSQAAGLGARSEWVATTSNDPPTVITLHSRYADLTILGQVDPDAPSHGLPDLPERVALGAGGPVLIVPYAGRFETVGERVMVAWNASAQAARAVHDALPMLGRAKQVIIVAIATDESGGGLGPVPDIDIRAYLSRHGIEAEVSRIPGGKVGPGDLLLSRAADEAVDLLVMGVYGHSRVRELVLGGVSRQIFAQMTLPVLMSH
ncbi:MAG TPA: universal stress protein [Alphaproteobacteria bacterium]|nr:universal stress protein [Alphaproteobacteria bacterium]